MLLASAVVNSVKALAGLDDKIMLISPIVLEPILRLKGEILGSASSVLKLDDVLIALVDMRGHQPHRRFSRELPSKAQRLRFSFHTNAAFRG